MKWLFLVIGIFALLAVSAFAESGRPWRASDSIERAKIGIYAPDRKIVTNSYREGATQKRVIVCTLSVSYLIPRYICEEK